MQESEAFSQRHERGLQVWHGEGRRRDGRKRPEERQKSIVLSPIACSCATLAQRSGCLGRDANGKRKQSVGKISARCAQGRTP